MAVNTNPTTEFLQALKESESILSEMSFTQFSALDKGNAQYIQYKRGDTIAEFIFGPPEFHVEMIVYVSEKKYALADLLKIPALMEWAAKNRYTPAAEGNIRGEVLWFIEFLRVSLPYIETPQ